MNVRSVVNEGVDLLVRYEDLSPQPVEEEEPRRASSVVDARPSRSRRHRPAPQHEIATQFLVNATGTWGSPFVPYYPGMADFGGRHLHTSDYADAEDFRDKHVVVVGGGTSAIGFMLELEEVAAGLTWVSRRPIDWLDRQELDLEGASAAVAMQDEAARSGRALPSIVSGTGVPKSRRIAAGIERGLLVARPMFDRIEPDRVRVGRRRRRHGPRRRHHLGDRVPSRPAPPRSAEAAREGRRHHRRRRARRGTIRASSSPATARRPRRSARAAPVA